MTIDDKIRFEKLQCDINREAVKISLSSGKTHKYEYLLGEEIQSSDQRGVIKQATLSCSPLGKAWGKQRKYNWRTKKKQIDTITN